VLHVMSFDSPWRWTDGQWAGFLDGLADPAVQTLVFQLDVKRHRSAAAKAERGRLALEAVRQWGPDLVYLSDDDAVEQVARPLAGSGLPLVFSGVNRSLQDHGLVGAPNVTGVLEREHVAETLRLLQVLVPAARRLAVVSDGASYWDRVIERVRVRAGQRPDMTLARVDRVASLADYQQRLRECEREVDAVLHLGILTLTGSDGATVPYQQVQRWVAEHVQLPDASFWSDRVHHGTLVAMAVSEVEQGRAAGRLARAILHDGQAPASLPVQATTKGRPVLCLPRAMRLGLRPSSSLLLSAEVVRRYAWEGA
jgi:ABC-type uncharacterized transport system substrate-binding protein